MKSAYELAMERLQKESPSSGPVTEDLKKQLAEIDRVYDAKIAEREVYLSSARNKSRDPEERQKLEQELVDERKKINAEREAKKDKIRS
ncbi:hypothetical protein [Cerasicoccus arenae]|uniref:Uncharacterized protein n=1 Tax=Cerasicoccus arenae TaxID=424488 RepID=A0A8J3DHW6_9BACT|nr:hypothetical protein [Cerasicoccus arenae]MBK1857861.1 hypothetical protein [Cerasicoccus arenae]GHC09305.1 hypothetical protein GCM10007047_28120 [Cerasicoccus arenae]